MPSYIQMHKATNRLKLVAISIIKEVIKKVQINQPVIILNRKRCNWKKVALENNEPIENISRGINHSLRIRWEWWRRIRRIISRYGGKNDRLRDDE